jgi:hypothetical protein
MAQAPAVSEPAIAAERAPSPGGPAASRRVFFGIALVSFSSLMLEVVFTRIFSAMMFYHFTFLAIALALFGVGASGVYVYVRSDRFPVDRVRQDLSQNSRRFAAATVLALVYVLVNPITEIASASEVPAFESRLVLQLILFTAFAALPFFFAGLVIALGIAHYRQSVDRLYAYDLVGAALAALAAGALLGLLGGPSLVLGVALTAMGAAVLFEKPRRLGWVPLAAAGILFAGNLWRPFITLPSIKDVDVGRLVFEKWNAFSRVTVERVTAAAWSIKIDAGAATDIYSSLDVRDSWEREVSALVYSLFDGGPEHALIIGPGGGRDVVHALASGARRVTGVEVNPIISDSIMRGAFLRESAGLYRDPRVLVVTDEGRSFIRRSRERYDVIQASLVDTWAATAAGAFALTENTLYTLEAFEDYYAHLTDRGAITFSRWRRAPESVRLLLLAAGALEKRGVPPKETRNHLFYVVKRAYGTLIAKRNPFTQEELDRLEAACSRADFRVVLSARTPGTHHLEQVVDAGAWSDFVRQQPDDLSPPTDDRPFFFYFVKPEDLWNLGKHFTGEVKIGNPAVWVLLALGATLSGLTVAFILLPLLLHRADALHGGSAGAARRRASGLLYFALIGLAFITVEIALLQKLTFFLGHPSYALLVVLFSLLAATGIGARLSGRVGVARCGRLALASGLALAAICGAYAVSLGPALTAWVAWPLAARVALATALVGVAGLLMGVMLPSGVRLLSRRDPEIIPWSWGVNGATSVIATVAATILAIHHGYTVTLLWGAGFYGLAGGGAALLGRLEAEA